MAAPPLPPPLRQYIAPADVQGTPLAQLLIAHPDAAAAVFSHLTYADAAPLRAACVGFRGAVAEHPWAPPVPLPLWVTGLGPSSAVATPAGLARWRAAFPAGRTLEIESPFAPEDPPLSDADVAVAAAWGLTGVAVWSVLTLTRAGLAALSGPALTDLCLRDTPQLSGADVAAVTAASPRLRTLRLERIGPLADADLAGWGGVHDLTAITFPVAGFTWDGVRHFTAVRELDLPLSPHADVNWAGDAFRGLVHLTRLLLASPVGYRAAVRGPAGLFAPGGLPRSLRRVALHGLVLAWSPGVEPDGGAVLLRPLAGVPDVSLVHCNGVTDGGLCALAGVTMRLEVACCFDVAGERLEPLGHTVRELTVEFCDRFTGGGLGSLAALRRLSVAGCPEFRAGAFAAVAAGCAALARVDVAGNDASEFDAAAAEAALLVAAGGGGDPWTFTRSEYNWAAVRRLEPAPAAGGAGGAVVAPTPVPAGAAGDAAAAAAAAAAALPYAAHPPPPPPARRQRVGGE
jgi:hypothetical protein